MKKNTFFGSIVFIALAILTINSAYAEAKGNNDLAFAQVTFVEARQSADGRWCFDTTVRHNDQGWDHYADEWTVMDQQGNQLASRVLFHPHDQEQPFTRSQCNIEIPINVTAVTVRAKCNQHGYGGVEVTLDLTVSEGDRFKVIR